jgi:hypothetical protein
MGVCLISILLSITPGLVPSAASALFQPVVLQIEPTFKGYADSPRPGHVSRMHVTGAVSGKFLIKKVVPEYPADARAAGVEGDVVFAIVTRKKWQGRGNSSAEWQAPFGGGGRESRFTAAIPALFVGR